MEQQNLNQQQKLLYEIEVNLIEWSDNIIKSIDFFKTVNPNENHELLEIILNQIGSFSEFLTLTAHYLQKLYPQTDFLPLKLHLLSILKALKSSVQAEDFIAVHDLITEELRDNLTKWKITILPMAKNIQATNQEFQI
jgi:hypothetical protein